MHPILIWERTKKLIRVHKISQGKFSAYIGISFGTLKNWLYYGIMPEAETTYNIVIALAVSIKHNKKIIDAMNLIKIFSFMNYILNIIFHPLFEFIIILFKISFLF